MNQKEGSRHSQKMPRGRFDHETFRRPTGGFHIPKVLAEVAAGVDHDVSSFMSSLEYTATSYKLASPQDFFEHLNCTAI